MKSSNRKNIAWIAFGISLLCLIELTSEIAVGALDAWLESDEKSIELPAEDRRDKFDEILPL